jgi:hypothetical protein
MFNPYCHKRHMDMGFSRRHANGQRRAQAEQLAILLSEIATRQSETPTARAAMLTRSMNVPNGLILPIATFAANAPGMSPIAHPSAFHERVANSVATENQET